MPATDSSASTAALAQTSSTGGPAKIRYAIKTALSLTLAYLIPMGMGWPQPQTAAITVMLIAASGPASESLQKGVLRVLGTIAGAVIGLTLIALFPQDRVAYLLAASIVVSLLAYLYNAYQGDSTLIMLTVVVTLMVFNGGDAEGAFLYGSDRAFITAFGVIVYTVVVSTLWPVRAVDNSRKLAASVATGYRRAFALLAHPVLEGPDNSKQQLATLLASEAAFQTHFTSIKGNAESVDAYLAEWNCVLYSYEQLQSLLLPALAQQNRHGVDFSRYLENHTAVVEQVEAMLQQVEDCWLGVKPAHSFVVMGVDYRADSLQDAPHLTVAAVAARAELLDQIQTVLAELRKALDSMLFDGGDFASRHQSAGKPSFIWLDWENAKTALRMFVTFWIATGVWIALNPPMGFSFVALCSVLVLLVSFTPVTPKLLFILLTMGFIFALPAYVFLLPQLTHWIELATFIFAYAFVGFYVFPGPVSIFFLLGLFALGIQNTMSYNVVVILLVMMNFYLLCAMLIITVYFPFSSKPEHLYTSLCHRFFRSSSRTLARASDYRRPLSSRSSQGAALLGKLLCWGEKIDSTYFPANQAHKIARLNDACKLLQGQIEALEIRHKDFTANRLIALHQSPGSPLLLVTLCNALANGLDKPGDNAFNTIETRLLDVRERLDKLREQPGIRAYKRSELAEFFVFLNLQVSILDSLRACRDAYQDLDWQQLSESRF